jgi:hypothetical protein
VLAATLVLAPVALADSPTIYEMAPPTTIFAVGMDDADATLDRLKGTSLWDMVNAPRIVELRTSIKEQIDEHIQEMMEGLDVTEDAFQRPTGAAGFAFFTTMDNELGTAVPGYVAFADYGAGAADVEEMIEAVKRKIDEDPAMEYDERDVRGRTVLSFVLPQDEMPAEADEFGMGNPAEAMLESLDTVHLVRDGNVYLVASDIPTLEHALGARDGDAPESMAQRNDFQGVMGQLDDPGDVSAVLLLRPLGPLVTAMDPMGMMMMITPMLKQVIGDVEGFGMNARIDGPSAMIEQTITAYMPRGKVGLSALMSRATPSGTVPGFVGANTMSFTEVSFDFQGLPAALLPVTQMMQMMMPPEAQGEGPGFAEMLDQFCSCLGSKLYMVQTLDRPIEADSLRQFAAIECTKPQEMERLLGLVGPQMGLEGRDFLGHRIYAMNMDAMGMMMGGGLDMEPPSVGIGGGLLFAGPSASVEQALRTIGDAGQATLADEDDFTRAMEALGNGQAVGWGYTNVIDSIAVARATTNANIEQMIAEMEALDPDGVDDFRAGAGEAAEWLDKFDPGFLKRFIGPSAWAVTSTDDGFVMKSILLDGGGE